VFLEKLASTSLLSGVPEVPNRKKVLLGRVTSWHLRRCVNSLKNQKSVVLPTDQDCSELVVCSIWELRSLLIASPAVEAFGPLLYWIEAIDLLSSGRQKPSRRQETESRMRFAMIYEIGDKSRGERVGSAIDRLCCMDFTRIG